MNNKLHLKAPQILLDAACLTLAFTANAQKEKEADIKPKAATEFTKKINDSFYGQLNFADPADSIDANKGFIVTLDSGIIYNQAGKIIVNQNDYKFIKGKAPASVNPSLWRQAKLNNLNGLYKVTEGVYEVREFDAANIAFIETKTGYIVVDPLTNSDAARAPYNIVKKGKPVVAVITTHSHADHFGGVEGVVSKILPKVK